MIDDAAPLRDPLRASDVTELGGLTILSEREGEIHTIRVSGELDLATADGVQAELNRVEASDARSIVLDLSGLAFMDSTGVRLLVQAHARSREDSERLTMLRGRTAVQRVLQLSGVDVLLPFAD